MKSLIESVKAMYAPQTEATMMQDDGKVVHNCAQHVEHATWGKGNCITEEHADPDRYGNIAWYDIEFPHGIEKGVPVSELKILQAESHGHETKAKKKKMAEATVDEGVADMAKKVGKAAFKAVTGGSDEDQLKDLQKKMGVQQTGKKPVKEDFDIDFTDVEQVIIHAPVEIELATEAKDYKAYFNAALKAKGAKDPSELGDDEAKKKFFKKVDAGYAAKNEEVFAEAWMNSHIQDVIAAHKKAGNRVSDEKSTTRDGKPFHSYVITTPEGKRTRHIHHGSTKRLETMSPAPKSSIAQSMKSDNDK